MFDGPGRFWKGNLHTHSTRSDGALEPEAVCRAYRENGYDFLALTDHFAERFDWPIVDTRPHRTDDFTTLIGAELHSGANRQGDVWHILAVGLPLDFARNPMPDDQGAWPESGGAIARRARDAGAYVAIAHPHWSMLTEADMEEIDAAHAVEVYNHGCDVECDRGYGLSHWDTQLAAGRRLSACATDDAHFHVADHFGGWTMVWAEANEPDALLEALKAGRTYCSTGPAFHDLRVEADTVHVRCSPVDHVIVQSPSYVTAAKLGHGMTDVTVPRERTEGAAWVRVTLIDKAGKRAWSNPVWARPE